MEPVRSSAALGLCKCAIPYPVTNYLFSLTSPFSDIWLFLLCFGSKYSLLDGFSHLFYALMPWLISIKSTYLLLHFYSSLLWHYYCLEKVVAISFSPAGRIKEYCAQKTLSKCLLNNRSGKKDTLALCLLPTACHRPEHPLPCPCIS